MIKIKNILFLSFFIFYNPLFADNVIIIPLRHAPEEVRREVEADYKSKWDAQKFAQFDHVTPAEMSKKMVKNEIKKLLTPSLSGFWLIYGGYITNSSEDGIVTFPLRHSTDRILLAITSEIKLIKVKENTFSHAEYLNDAAHPVKLYQFEKKQDEKQAWYWMVKEIPIPADKKIDPTTIILLSKPKNIFVSEIKTLAEKTDQLILPPLYVLDNTEKESIILKILEIKNLFETIKIQEKKISDTATQKMITNI